MTIAAQFFVSKDAQGRSQLAVVLGPCGECEGSGFREANGDPNDWHTLDCESCNGTGGRKTLFDRAAIDFADSVKLTEEQGHQYTAAYEHMVSERYPVEASKS